MDASANASPMIEAYSAARRAAPGHLMLYRVGEFYEALMEDAAVISKALGIQLTRRRQKDSTDTPMCGVPAGSATAAVNRLLAAGHKVALSEQPPEPGAERPLVLMTPGTSVEADVLEGGRSNNLTVALTEGETVAFAWIDLSTGEAGTRMSSLDGCGVALARIAPSEILVARWPETSEALAVAIKNSGTRFSDLPEPGTGDEARAVLASAYGDKAQEVTRGHSPPEVAALAALLAMIRAVVGRLPDRLLPPRRSPLGDTMEIDVPTLRGLEVLTSGAGRAGSLLSVLDRTVIAAGARLLAGALCAPLTRPDTIGRRLAMVRFLVSEPKARASCREHLSGMPDMLRACGRVSLGKAGPRDLATVRDGLERAMAAAAPLSGAAERSPDLAVAARDLATATDGPCRAVLDALRRALILSPPVIGQRGRIHCTGIR